MRRCLWCEEELPESDVVRVGLGHGAYACPPCMRVYGLLALSEHPAGSDGAPLAVDRRYIGHRYLPPIAPGRPS